MKNRVEQYFAEVYGGGSSLEETLPKSEDSETHPPRTLVEGKVLVHGSQSDFRALAAETLADLIESLHGRSIEYEHSDVPKAFDRAKFISYHANPEVWDAPHAYRAGALELLVGTKDVMPKPYDVNLDDFNYDPTNAHGLADEPSAHIVWHFPNKRFDGYLLKESDGQLRFIVLSDKQEAYDTVHWLSNLVAERFSEKGYNVTARTERKQYTQEL